MLTDNTTNTALLANSGPQTPPRRSKHRKINKNNFKIGFLAGVGTDPCCSKKSIQAYFKHVLPVWAAATLMPHVGSKLKGYCGVEESMGIIEGQLHRVRMSVYGKTTPNWEVIARCARKTVAITMDTSGNVAVVKRQLQECVDTPGAPDKSAVADGIMWTLVHNKPFMQYHERFEVGVKAKLHELIASMHCGLSDEQNHHLHLQLLAYFQMFFPTSTPPVPGTPFSATTAAPNACTPKAPSPLTLTRTRSGRVSKPPTRLTH